MIDWRTLPFKIPNKAEKDVSRTLVWWDIDNYPVPSDCDAHQIAQNIRRALRSLGYNGPLTITAIGKLTDVPSCDLRALSSTGVALKIVSCGDLSIMDDIFGWIETNSPPANLLLLSENEIFVCPLGLSRLEGYNILYAYIHEDMKDLNFPEECFWQNILEDARKTPRHELQSETGECDWFCEACKLAGVQNIENFFTHLNSVEHSQKMLK